MRSVKQQIDNQVGSKIGYHSDLYIEGQVWIHSRDKLWKQIEDQGLKLVKTWVLNQMSTNLDNKEADFEIS